jgi:hypothetical protein
MVRSRTSCLVGCGSQIHGDGGVRHRGSPLQLSPPDPATRSASRRSSRSDHSVWARRSQSSAGIRPSRCSLAGRRWPSRPRSMRPAGSGTLRCLVMAGCVSGEAPARWPALASPAPRRWRIARRVGSPGAVKARLRGSSLAITLRLYNLMVTVNRARVDQRTPTRCRPGLPRHASSGSCRQRPRARWVL